MNSPNSTDELLIFSALSGLAFLLVLRIWIREILFYRRNGWDFTKDSGFRGSIGPSADGGLPVTKEVSPRVRVLVALPFMLIILLFFSIILPAAALH